MGKQSRILSAASNGEIKQFLQLIGKDESLIDAIDENGDTVLHLACCSSKATVVFAKQIIDKNPHLVNKTNNDGCKPIHITAQCGNANVFWYLVNKDKSLIDAVDNNGDTVLHKACIDSDAFFFVKEIVDKYPHLLIKTNNIGQLPIHIAVANCNSYVFWFFIAKDESLIDAVDKDGDSVLHSVCAFFPKSKLIKWVSNKFFIEYDAVDLAKQITDKYPHLINKTNIDGCKPIQIAAFYGNNDVFWYFIDKDESLINEVDEDGDTVLHYVSTQSDAVDLAKEITDKHPHLIQKRNNDGCKPIHFAAGIGNANVFWYFIDKDKNLIDTVDKDGKTVLDHASGNLAKEITDKYPHLVDKTEHKLKRNSI